MSETNEAQVTLTQGQAHARAIKEQIELYTLAKGYAADDAQWADAEDAAVMVTHLKAIAAQLQSERMSADVVFSDDGEWMIMRDIPGEGFWGVFHQDDPFTYRAVRSVKDEGQTGDEVLAMLQEGS